MAIFLNSDSKLIVQGMTGSEGMKHTQRMLACGSNIVGGVNPKKAGSEVEFDGGVKVPVFGTVKEAMDATGANVSVQDTVNGIPSTVGGRRFYRVRRN